MPQLIDKSLQNRYVLQNVGLFDRIIRVVVGLAMIGFWFFYPVESVNIWLALLALVGIYPLLSGILGWCPIYAMLHTKTCGSDEHNSCGTFPDQVEHMMNDRH
jgi:hypothetical protein